MANTDLTIKPETNLKTLSSEPPLSDKLSALLASGETPVIGPNTAAALQEWIDAQPTEIVLPDLARIENMITRLSLATKERARSVAEAEERLALYWRALRDLPLIDLRAAFDKILKTSTFMPTPAEVRKAALGSKAQRDYRLSRAKHLIWRHETEWFAPVTEADQVKPDELEELVKGIEGQFPSQRSAA